MSSVNGISHNTSVFSLAVMLLLSIACNPSTSTIDRQNVLLISIDDLNDWVGAMGGHPQAITPNIDRLASRGVIFLNAHVQAPLCGPSRASLMSGLRPSTTGIYGQIGDADVRMAHPLLQDIAFLPEYFGQHGYKTMGVGKLFHRHAPDGVFEESGGRSPGFGPKPESRLQWDQQGTSTDWGAFPDADSLMPDYAAADWAIDRLDQVHDRPFFLAVGFLRPHVPWHVPPAWFDLHPLDSITVPPYLPDDMDDIPAIGHRVADVPMMPTTEWAIEQGQWPAIVQALPGQCLFRRRPGRSRVGGPGCQPLCREHHHRPVFRSRVPPR